MSASVLALSMISRRPTVRAASSNSAIRMRLSGLTRAPIKMALGASSLRRPICFGTSGERMLLTPVRLPPGRLRLATRPDSTGVTTGHEDDRNCRGRRFCRECRDIGERDDNGHLTANQIAYQYRQTMVLIFCPAIIDRHVTAFGIASFAEALVECAH
jgi:hypothetical protein